jgi:hypothetical protein
LEAKVQAHTDWSGRPCGARVGIVGAQRAGRVPMAAALGLPTLARTSDAPLRL